MRNINPNPPPARDLDLEQDLIEDLERQSIQEIRKLRKHDRVEIRVNVALQPGNSSETANSRVQGYTRDLSQGGCRAIFPVPIGVGDVFRLQFDRAKLDLPLVFGRCLRCRLNQEDAFEAAFSFFVPISLDNPATPGIDSLID